MSQEVRFKMNNAENRNNDEYLSSKNIGQKISKEGRRLGIERRVWTSGRLLGNCTI